MEANPRFKIGDRVRVVNHHSFMWISKKSEPEKQMAIDNMNAGVWQLLKETDTLWFVDIWPKMVGTTGTVKDITMLPSAETDTYMYSLADVEIPEAPIEQSLTKTAWYNQNQLELI